MRVGTKEEDEGPATAGTLSNGGASGAAVVVGASEDEGSLVVAGALSAAVVAAAGSRAVPRFLGTGRDLAGAVEAGRADEDGSDEAGGGRDSIV